MTSSSANQAKNCINHVVLLLDASTSMEGLADEVIKVVDNQVSHLAQRSKDLNQETRVTIYTFGTTAQCVIYDMDVLRLPSIRTLYTPYGWTALADAATLAMHDLAQTPEMYGDHAFLLFLVTDGDENRSQRDNVRMLPSRLARLPKHWTFAVLVPDQQGKFWTKKLGFQDEDVAIWDATSRQGVEEVGETIRKATDFFMDGRAQGIRGGRSVFSTGADAVNPETVKAAGLTPLRPSSYKLVPVPRETQIRPFVEECGYTFKVGLGYYQLKKSEEIQASKAIAVVEKATDRVFVGDSVRSLIGLPQMTVRVKPDFNDLYDIYVQSTSVNRKLHPGTKLLIIP